MVCMKAVSVSELKAHLSKYLREVRRGGEIQVLERGVPVARLTRLPPSADPGDDDAARERLIRAGVLRAGTGGVAALLEDAPVNLENSLAEALDRDRDDRL